MARKKPVAKKKTAVKEPPAAAQKTTTKGSNVVPRVTKKILEDPTTTVSPAAPGADSVSSDQDAANSREVTPTNVIPPQACNSANLKNGQV